MDPDATPPELPTQDMGEELVDVTKARDSPTSSKTRS
jgi:hypothetical protein